ncbi:hypothetical protein T484DRAFT_1902329, partial [Baffinella frigidus]
MGINSHDGAGCESAGRRGAGGEQDDERARWQKPFGHKGAHRRTARRGRSAWPAAGVLLLFAAFAAGAVTSDVTDTTITTLSVGLIPAGVPFTTEFIAAGDFNFSNAVVVAIANSGGCASTDQWLEMLALTAGSEHRSAPIAVAERAVGTYDICLQANNGAVHTQAVKLVVFTVEDWQGAGGSAALLGAPNVTLRLNCSSWCGGAGVRVALRPQGNTGCTDLLENTSVAFSAEEGSGGTDVVLPVAVPAAGAWGVCWSPSDGATFYALPEVLRVVVAAHEGSVSRFTPYSVTKTLEAAFVFYGAACSSQSFLGLSTDFSCGSPILITSL